MTNEMGCEAFSEIFDALSGFGKCYDVNKRGFTVGEKSALLYFISSLSDSRLLEEIISFCMSRESTPKSIDELCSSFISGASVEITKDIKGAARGLLSGMSVLYIDGLGCMAVMETRSLPTRSVSEPDSDHVLKGSHDGFCESLNTNAGLIRRRIRSEKLCIEKLSVGDVSGSDVALCYMEDTVDEKLLKRLRSDIKNIRVDALSMAQESLAECLVKKRWYNPFPRFRYTERPDAASAMILEGSVIVICDNSPQVMILPCAILDFTAESNDYYFPPLIGTYLRLVRITVFVFTLFVTPLWYLLIRNPEYIPDFFRFAFNDIASGPPILFQLLLVEFTVDALKLASLNTPSALGSSLSVVAGLIIGDFAVQTGWLAPDVILYMSFVAMSNFTQPSYELGYALKFSRILLLVMIGILDLAGLLIGTFLIVLMIVFNRVMLGDRGYLYPIFPYRKKALLRQLVRVKLRPKGKKQ